MLYQLSYFRKNKPHQSAPRCLERLLQPRPVFSGKRWIRTTEGVRQQIYSLPHLATLVSSHIFLSGSQSTRCYPRLWLFRADGGIRTPDQLITNQLLWPTELHRHYYRFGLQIYEHYFYLPNFSIKNFIIHFVRSKNLRFRGFPIRSKPKSGAKIVINTNSQNRKGIFFSSKRKFLSTLYI